MSIFTSLTMEGMINYKDIKTSGGPARSFYEYVG